LEVSLIQGYNNVRAEPQVFFIGLHTESFFTIIIISLFFFVYVTEFGNKVIRSDSIALLRLKRTHDRMEIESELYTLRHDDAITMMSL
jgi:hypothetical protein